VLEAPGEDDRLAQAGRRGAVGAGGPLRLEAVEEAQQVPQRRARAALRLAAGGRDRPGGLEVAGGQRAASRTSRRTSGQAATSRSTPLETMSLPT
jgi:hypothetical protein